MAIQITSTGNNSFLTVGRAVFRNSAGIPFVLVQKDTTGFFVYYGENIDFTGGAAGSGWPNETDIGGLAGAMDGNDILHISWLDNKGKISPLRYTTFNTLTHSLATPVSIVSDIGGAPLTIYLSTSMAIDSSNIPHIAYVEMPSIMGTDSYVVMYTNRIGGSWKSSVQVHYVSGDVCLEISMEIDSNDTPFIAYNFGYSPLHLETAIGNANNATGFTLMNWSPASDVGGIGITVDERGDHFLIYKQGSVITLLKHSKGDAWTGWSTFTATFQQIYNAPTSLVSVGTDIYFFYEDVGSSDINYQKFDGATWGGVNTLEVGTFLSARARWAYWHDNDSLGALIIQADSVSSTNYIQGTGGTSEKQALTLTGITTGRKMEAISFRVGTTGSPTDNIWCRVYTNADETGMVGASNQLAPGTLAGGTALTRFTFPLPITMNAGQTYYFVLERTGSRDTSNYFTVRNSAVNLNADWSSATKNSGTWTPQSSGYEIPFKIRFVPNELDYAWVDETATPDLWWNTLSLAAPTTWIQKSLKWYNGSTWVAKPLKYYNGASWITKLVKSNL